MSKFMRISADPDAELRYTSNSDRQLTPSFELKFFCADMFPYEDSKFVSARTLRKEITLASSISVLQL